MIRRQRGVIVVAVMCAIVSTSGLVLAQFVRSPQQAEAEAQPPDASLITAPVTEQVLATSLIFRASVGPADLLELTPSVSSASGATEAVVSSVKVEAGDTIRPGQLLVEVSGRPLFALAGLVPAYRDLKPGSTGPDVRQLQEALKTLGYFSGKPTGTFDPATESAVVGFYDAAGYPLPDPGGPDGDDDKEAGPMVPAAEVAYVPSFPAQILTLSAKVGRTVTAPLVSISTGGLEVTAQLDPADATLVRVGLPARLDSELLGESADAAISAIGSVTTATQTGQNEEAVPGEPYVPVTLTPSQPLTDAWNGRDIRVTVTLAQTEGAVLAVPIAALTTRADGQTVVTVVNPDGSTRHVVVRAGTSADGLVEISPVEDPLLAGDMVSVGIGGGAG